MHVSVSTILLSFLVSSSVAFLPIHRPSEDDDNSNLPRAVRREHPRDISVRAVEYEGTNFPKLKLNRRARSRPVSSKDSQGQTRKLRARTSQTERRQAQQYTGHLDNLQTDYSYTVAVTLGNPGQKVQLVVDTGAQWTWVVSSQCQSSICNGRAKYDSSKSTSYTSAGSDFVATYGASSTSGNYATDSLKFAGFDVKAKLGVVAVLSDAFDGVPLDGLLGLGDSTTSRDSKQKNPSILDDLYDSKQISQRIFGINLSRYSDNKDDGEITFGGYDASAFTGSVNWIPLARTGNNWSIKFGGIGVNGLQRNGAGRIAIIDTGLSAMMFPVADAQALMSQFPGLYTATVPGGYDYYLPCDTKGTISVSFGSATYAINPNDFLTTSKDTATGLCYVNLIARSTSPDFVLGDPFIKNVYTIFDVDGGRVGFGKKGPITGQRK